MTQYTLAGAGTPETRTSQRPRPSKPLPFTLRIAEQPTPSADAPVLCSSQAVADFIRPQIGNADRETFIILHMDPKNRVKDVELHSIGDLDSAAIYPRQVMRSALLRNAAALIFCHNHPSGDSAPSLCDRELTRDLVAAAHTLQIKVLDHVIVGGGQPYFSMADQGLIEDFERIASGPCREDRTPYYCRNCRAEGADGCPGTFAASGRPSCYVPEDDSALYPHDEEDGITSDHLEIGTFESRNATAPDPLAGTYAPADGCSQDD